MRAGIIGPSLLILAWVVGLTVIPLWALRLYRNEQYMLTDGRLLIKSGKKENYAYSHTYELKNIVFAEKCVECPHKRQGDQKKCREEKSSVHKIPASPNHEKSMKKPGKKHQYSVLQNSAVF